VRNQREPWAGAVVGVTASLGAAAIPLAQQRLSVIGTYAQFHGDFGLSPFGGVLLQGVVCMTLWSLAGLALVAYRISAGAPRT
jgi:hypothetical protein